MRVEYLLFICIVLAAHAVDESEEPVSYYYGLEESERGLPLCGERQACSVLLARYWRRAALLRLCRCPRRARCPPIADATRALELNNRAYFMFCQSVEDWPYCSSNEDALTVEASKPNNVPMDPDRLEQLHHENIHLLPPKIDFKCRCPEPYSWELHKNYTRSRNNTKSYYCRPLPSCRSGQFCGNVNYKLHSLYQSCLCPNNHICVHNGGVSYVNISELLYEGKGRQAYCQRGLHEVDSYEDY